MGRRSARKQPRRDDGLAADLRLLGARRPGNRARPIRRRRYRRPGRAADRPIRRPGGDQQEVRGDVEATPREGRAAVGERLDQRPSAPDHTGPRKKGSPLGDAPVLEVNPLAGYAGSATPALATGRSRHAPELGDRRTDAQTRVRDMRKLIDRVFRYEAIDGAAPTSTAGRWSEPSAAPSTCTSSSPPTGRGTRTTTRGGSFRSGYWEPTSSTTTSRSWKRLAAARETGAWLVMEKRYRGPWLRSFDGTHRHRIVLD